MKFLLDHDVPDDLEYALTTLGHEVHKVRDVLSKNAADEQVLCFATDRAWVLITCNRDDFLKLAAHVHHAGIVVLIRRRSRAQERARLVRLLDKAGEQGIVGCINFA